MQPEEVLGFWFADACDSPAAANLRNTFWFGAAPETDHLIWEEFGDTLTDAANSFYDDWRDTACGRLALIIVLDQLPRNIFRGTSEVFRYDATALELAGQGVTLGHLAGLSVPEQAFFLMPYQHSEDIAVQRAGLDLMRALVDAAAPEWQAVSRGFLNFAVRHHDIVEEYGRFPHRNSLLGRNSTDEETRFLAEGGATFGQSGQA
jgi:uncharacterized protein (DUF924 family)